MKTREQKVFELNAIGVWSNPQRLGEIAGSEAAQVEFETPRVIEGISFRPARLLVNGELNVTALKEVLFREASAQKADLVVREIGSGGPFQGAKLLVMDVDSTVIQNEMIDELARERGVYREIEEITERAMRGELDFRQSLAARMAMLVGLDEADLRSALSRMRLSPGATELVASARQLGCKTVLVSGGFRFAVEVLQERLGIDEVHANQLDMPGGCFTGRVLGEIVDAGKKASLLEESARKFGVPVERVLAVGDGANDALMLQKAGLGIGFKPKPVLWKSVSGIVTSGDLRSVIPLLHGSSDADG